MENEKPTPGQQVRTALAAVIGRPRPRPQPTPEFVAYLNTLDAMESHIVVYLMAELKIPSSSIPTLLPMIDQRWFVDRLESEVSFTLKELEDLEKGE